MQVSATENDGGEAIWGGLQCQQSVLTAQSHRWVSPGTSLSSPPGQAQPGPALPAVVDGTDWAVLKAGRRKTLLLMESSAKESNAKLVPRALLIFNYY